MFFTYPIYSVGLGFHEGFYFPTGFHNAIPERLRKYVPTFPKTVLPMPLYNGWSQYEIYTLGMKAIPNRTFTSLSRQMYRAVIDSDFEAMEKILNSGKYNLSEDIVLPELGLTAMGLACNINNIEAVHYFTKRGVDYEKRIGPFEKTALHIAIECGNELLTKFLLKNGASLSSKDYFGFDSYDKAEFRGFSNFKPIFDYYRDIRVQKVRSNYEDYKYTREVVLEDMDTLRFKPSDLFEPNFYNKMPNITNDKINIDSFQYYVLNQYDLNHLQKTHEGHERTNYDSLYYYNLKI